MNLFQTMDLLMQDCKAVFAQDRTFDRVRRLTCGQLLSAQGHTTSAAICTLGRQFQDWSADYRAFYYLLVVAGTPASEIAAVLFTKRA